MSVLSPSTISKGKAFAGTRTYFKIPYAQRERAKKLGALWDPETKLWYALNAEARTALAVQWPKVPRVQKVQKVSDVSYIGPQCRARPPKRWTPYEK